MTPEQIRKANLIKMGFTCNKCGLIYGEDHPMDAGSWYSVPTDPKDIVDKCNNTGDGSYYTFKWKRIARNFTLFRVKGQWYKVRGPLVDMFLKMAEIEEGVQGNIHYPKPIDITRQVDIFTAAEKLGLPPPLNTTQKRRAKSKAFVERIKG